MTIIEFPRKPPTFILSAGSDGYFLLLTDETGLPVSVGPFASAPDARAWAAEELGEVDSGGGHER